MEGDERLTLPVGLFRGENLEDVDGPPSVRGSLQPCQYARADMMEIRFTD